MITAVKGLCRADSHDQLPVICMLCVIQNPSLAHHVSSFRAAGALPITGQMNSRWDTTMTCGFARQILVMDALGAVPFLSKQCRAGSHD